jgi:hypothetical protein
LGRFSNILDPGIAVNNRKGNKVGKLGAFKMDYIPIRIGRLHSVFIRYLGSTDGMESAYGRHGMGYTSGNYSQKYSPSELEESCKYTTLKGVFASIFKYCGQ